MTVTIQEPVAPVVPVTTRDVLLRAADLIGEFGWTTLYTARCEDGCRTDPFGDGAASFCALGAYARAKYDLGLFRPSDMDDAYELEEEFNSAAGFGTHGGFRWNDAPGRTREEVIQRLREAAEAAA